MGRSDCTLVSPYAMRIVGFFIRSLLTLAVLAVIVYLIGGQIWMAVGLGTFFSDISRLEDAVTDVVSDSRLCQSAPASSVYSTAKAVQLRFTDERSYRVEIVCTLIEDTPVALVEGKLPMFIQKAPGSSGFYVNLSAPEATSFTIRSLRAEKKLVFDEKLLVAGSALPQLTSAAVPRTSCAGFGSKCCQSATEKGVGTAQSAGVLDCPGACFSSCQSIPSVVALTSDPYPSNNEVIMNETSLTVTFSYTTTYPGGKISKVTIDYGDGSTDDSTETIGVFTHTYTCVGPCRYKAGLHVVDSSGNSSVESDASTLYIVRR
ncbi:MAG: hypothetical protein ABI758_05365 [Candidatus Woesebacteria bacterium]